MYLSILDVEAPTDSWINERQGLGARAGSKMLAQAPRLQRHGALAQERRAPPILTARRYPRLYTGACAGRVGCRKPLLAGSSFCWGPSLEGPTSPFSSRSSTPGQVDRARREVRRPPLLPCARTSQPTHPVHGSCTFPPPCTAHAPLARLASNPPPSWCPRVRRSSSTVS